MRAIACLLLMLLAATALAGDAFEEPPINYGSSPAKNRVSDLLARAGRDDALVLPGLTRLERLRALLEQLKVPASSQVLVFSKTSLQRERISPRTPRAIYFSDDVYVGFCQGSDLLEISAVDPQLGAVFYTARLEGEQKASVVRQADDCLICHASSQTRQVPGHLVRSVFVDRSGLPLLSMGTHRIDHASRIQDRWAGWYVTGTHGTQTHLGNLVVTSARRPEEIDNAAGQNVTDLSDRIDVENYLTPHSDLVALMVLEHQTEGHNRMTRASYQCRQALYQQQQLNRELNKPEDFLWESTKSRIRSASEDLVKYFLFCEEAPLTGRLKGTSAFEQEFAARGRRDPQGRSLRDFDLERRMFKYPCSYLIETETFDSLPAEVREYVYKRLWDVLTEKDKSDTFKHLSVDDRRAIREILAATKEGLPEYWRSN
jgi:hypothetical protein